MTTTTCACGNRIADSRNKRCIDCWRIPRDVIEGEVEFLMGYGEHPERIAERLGKSTAAIARTLYRHGRPDLATPFNRAHKRALMERKAA